MHSETMMMSLGFDPKLSEGAVKPPVFLTSTFVFESAEDGEAYFDITSGRRSPKPGERDGLIYSRFNHPNAQIVEERLAYLEGAASSAVFSSGMAAIFTAALAYTKPGSVILHSQPLYGGTETLITKTFANMGVEAVGFSDGTSEEAILDATKRAYAKGPVSVVILETPSNPNNTLVDIALVRQCVDAVADSSGVPRAIILVDNTLLSPLFQRPLDFGADVSLHSLTKYIGGHSDLVAGAAIGSAEVMRPIRLLRSAIGTHLDPHSSWMVGRSLETLALRVQKSTESAVLVAKYLADHPRVTRVHHLDLLDMDERTAALYRKQCSGAGSTFSFSVEGGKEEAFHVLNKLRTVKLAVSLGGTESLACHPASTTHSGVPAEVREAAGVDDSTIRISIGIEHTDDLIEDLKQALCP